MSFSVMKQHCLLILQASHQAEKQIAAIKSLSSILSTCETRLEPYLDFLLLPLTLVLDKFGQAGKQTSLNGSSAAANLNLCTSTLSCIDSALKRCSYVTADQLVSLFPRLNMMLMTWHAVREEEASMLSMSCLQSLLQAVQPCQRQFCSCQQVPGTREPPWKTYDGPCALHTLQGEDMATPLGHLLSLLIQVTDDEATAGGKGSRAVRESALLTLRQVLNKVHNEDSLAFFLPGVVSGLVKAILRPARRPAQSTSLTLTARPASASSASSWNSTGAGGSTQAVCCSLLALGDILTLVLHDPVAAKSAEADLDSQLSGEATLLALRSLQSARNDSEVSVLKQLAAMDVKGEGEGGKKRLRVSRSDKWIEKTGSHVWSLLRDTLPLVCERAPPAARLSLLHFCTVVLDHCSANLASCSQLLLECIFSLSTDEEEEVSQSAMAALSRVHVAASLHSDRIWKDSEGRILVSPDLLHDSLAGLFQSLPLAVKAGQDKKTKLILSQMTAVILLADTDHFPSLMIHSEELAASFLGSFLEVLSFAPGPSHLLELNRSHGSPPVLLLESLEDASCPRMPSRLAYISNERNFNNLSRVLQEAGSMAAKCGSSALYSFCQPVMAEIRRSLSWLSQPGRRWPTAVEANGSAVQIDLVGDGDEFRRGSVQRRCSTLVLILNEILRGAAAGKSAESRAEAMTCLAEELVSEYASDAMMELTFFNLPPNAGVNSFPTATLNDNSLLQEMMLEGLGVLARCLGPSFCAHPTLLLSSLPPLMACMASTLAGVSCSAHRAMAAISLSSHASSISDLVASNADYVIDAICGGLRHLELNPRTPQLLLAVLRHTGAAPHILPLLQEPMRSVLLSVQVTARHRNAQHIVVFCQTVRELSLALESESSLLREKWESQIEALSSSSDSLDLSHGQAMESWQQRSALYRALSSLAVSCLDSMAPLTGSQQIVVQLLALDSVEAAVLVLSELDKSRKLQWLEREKIDQCFGVEAMDDYEGEDETKEEATNRLLPRVHQLWPHLVACLHRQNPAVVVRALQVIAQVTHCGGGAFMARRIRDDVWPVLSHIFIHGSPLPPLSYTEPTGNPLLTAPQDASKAVRLLPWQEGRVLQQSGRGDRPVAADSAPGARLMLRSALLRCLTVMAASSESRLAIKPLVKQLASASLPLLLDAELRQLASEFVLALSQLDPDSVWLLLADSIFGRSGNYRGNNCQCREVNVPLKLVVGRFGGIIQPWDRPEESLWGVWGKGVSPPWCGHLPLVVGEPLMNEIVNTTIHAE